MPKNIEPILVEDYQFTRGWYPLTEVQPFDAAMCGRLHLSGKISNHHTLTPEPDNDRVLTSYIKAIENGRLVITCNTLYKLGTPSATWVQSLEDAGITEEEWLVDVGVLLENATESDCN
jgi:hypothetical protein